MKCIKNLCLGFVNRVGKSNLVVCEKCGTVRYVEFNKKEVKADVSA